ncbi:MAG: CPBP family glutamic-type intramembrane protease [Chloroflexota bacterium]
MRKKQLVLFAILLAVYALVIFVSYAFFFDQLTQGLPTPAPQSNIPPWILGLANAGIFLVLYCLLGLAGYWFARKVGLPGVFREDGNWRGWVGAPLVYGLVLGIFLVAVDEAIAASGMGEHFIHPAFPFSLLASLSAGIGEEILFRGFVFGLWAFLLNLILKRWNKTGLALWLANVIAALAFAAGHLPAAMLLLKVPTPLDLPPVVIAELILLNGIVGIAAGERYMKDGLVAAAGVHFWADIVWHVIWPMVMG